MAEAHAMMQGQGQGQGQGHPLEGLGTSTQRMIGNFLYSGQPSPSPYISPQVSIRSGSSEIEFDEHGHTIRIRHPPQEPPQVEHDPLQEEEEEEQEEDPENTGAQ